MCCCSTRRARDRDRPRKPQDSRSLFRRGSNLMARIDHSTGAVCFFTSQLFIVANNGVSGTDVAVAALV